MTLAVFKTMNILTTLSDDRLKTNCHEGGPNSSFACCMFNITVCMNPDNNYMEISVSQGHVSLVDQNCTGTPTELRSISILNVDT